MAIVHNTTMNPGKLELLATWLPAQPWFAGDGRAPELAKVGGFRLDDPLGEVGIEFMLVADGPVVYQVPMTYHGRELPGAEGRLIGTSEHGVLGQRWIYDGIRDPVLVAQLVALIQGEAQAQAQSVSSTPDPSVTGQPAAGGSLAAISSVVGADGPDGTELLVDAAGPDGRPAGQLTVRVRRILQPDADGASAGADGAPAGDAAGRPCLSGTWRRPDGTRVRGVLATARYTPLMAAPRLAE
jgi:hypothetical protein